MADASDPEAERLAQRLLVGIEHLRNQRPAAAVAPLREVVEGLAEAADLVDVRARALSLLAQAYLETDRADLAKPPIDEALSIAPPSEDRSVLEELASRIRARVTVDDQAKVHSARLANLTVAEIEARSRDPRTRTEVLVRKANAETDVGRPDAARAIAERAIVDAMTLDDVKLEVLARLSLARAVPDLAAREIERSLRAADRLGDTTLITAVVKAAESHGVEVPKEAGPWESDR